MWNVEMSVLGPSCVKTRNFPDLGGPSPLAHTEIVEYRRSSEAKFLEQNFIRSFHTASVESRRSHFPWDHSSDSSHHLYIAQFMGFDASDNRDSQHQIKKSQWGPVIDPLI